MTIKMIIATSTDCAIGKGNSLLWHIPEDLKYFQSQTKGEVVLMGNNTFKSLQALGMEKGLPDRHNVVLSSSNREFAFLQKGEVTYIDNLERFIEWGSVYAKTILQKDVYVIGGANVYLQVKDFVQEIHWTQVDKTFPEADTFFDMSWIEDASTFEKVSETVLCEDATVKVYKRK
jgi:dihydrofolate reductase